jgi:hypothetical protein
VDASCSRVLFGGEVVCRLDRVAWALFVFVAPAAACGGTLGRDAQPRAEGTGSGSEAGSMPAAGEDDASPASAITELSEAATECAGDWLLPDSTGSVASNSNASGIHGQWSLHTDCEDFPGLEAGLAMPGENCSSVTAPASGSTFAPDPASSAICTAGSTVQVMADDEWGTRWGAYAALDLNDVGGAARDFDAVAAGVRGFCLFVSGTAAPIFRVRLASDQGFAGQNWYEETLQHEGWHQVLFSDLAQVDPTNVPFDPTKLLSIEVEVPASRLEAIPWDFCIAGLVALR